MIKPHLPTYYVPTLRASECGGNALQPTYIDRRQYAQGYSQGDAMKGEKKEYPLPTEKKTMNAASKYSELVLLGKGRSEVVNPIQFFV